MLNVSKPSDLKKLDKLLREMNKPSEPELIELSPLELKLEKVRLKEDGRKAAGIRRAKKNHERRLKKAENQRGMYRRKVRRWEAAANDGNWYPLVKRRWVQKGMKISLTEAEWNEHIAPHLPVDDVITVRRYNSKDKKITLDRIYVTSEDNKSTVYFDGKEYAMHKLGYILADSDQRSEQLTPDEAQS